jgi:lipoyl(octanoyl) transferase
MTIFDNPPVTWATASGLTDYEAAVRLMEKRVADIRSGKAPELVWLVEHPPLFSAGTSAKTQDIVQAPPFPLYATGRGGRITYHGPGQRVGYVMLDIRRRFGADVRAFVSALEQWIINSLERFGVRGETRRDRVGVWVRRCRGGHEDEAKIAALGIRVRGGVSYHGISLNVAPNLSHYDAIVPCGLGGFGVTSLAELGVTAAMEDVDISLRDAFERVFGPIRRETDA